MVMLCGISKQEAATQRGWPATEGHIDRVGQAEEGAEVGRRAAGRAGGGPPVPRVTVQPGAESTGHSHGVGFVGVVGKLEKRGLHGTEEGLAEWGVSDNSGKIFCPVLLEGRTEKGMAFFRRSVECSRRDR